MFTGLVEDLGEVVAVTPRGSGVQIAIRTSIPLSDVSIGDSIATDGACLTAETIQGDVFTAVAASETMALTTLKGITAGRKVHLERAMTMGGRLGGHLVQGHVDGVGVVVRAEQAAESRVLWIELPASLSRYVAAKGSICVDGVSMTVNEIEGHRFRINAVPHTQGVTKLGSMSTNDRVNVEVDILAKYVERLLGGARADGGVTLEMLQQYGFAR